jgi:hypothetical protein
VSTPLSNAGYSTFDISLYSLVTSAKVQCSSQGCATQIADFKSLPEEEMPMNAAQQNTKGCSMRHTLYFRTVHDTEVALQIIKSNFTQNVKSEGSVLFFVTPYKIRETAQTSLVQRVQSYQSHFNIEEGIKP